EPVPAGPASPIQMQRLRSSEVPTSVGAKTKPVALGTAAVVPSPQSIPSWSTGPARLGATASRGAVTAGFIEWLPRGAEIPSNAVGTTARIATTATVNILFAPILSSILVPFYISCRLTTSILILVVASMSSSLFANITHDDQPVLSLT